MYDCSPTQLSNTIIKFADDTTAISLISGRDETVCRVEVKQLAGWWTKHDVLINTSKTKEMVIDFSKHRGDQLHFTSVGTVCSRYQGGRRTDGYGDTDTDILTDAIKVLLFHNQFFVVASFCLHLLFVMIVN